MRSSIVWDAPFTISPHNHNTVYTGSQFVHMTKDGGRTVISPDLTRNDKSKQQMSGGHADTSASSTWCRLRYRRVAGPT